MAVSRSRPSLLLHSTNQRREISGVTKQTTQRRYNSPCVYFSKTPTNRLKRATKAARREVSGSCHSGDLKRSARNGQYSLTRFASSYGSTGLMASCSMSSCSDLLEKLTGILRVVDEPGSRRVARDVMQYGLEALRSNGRKCAGRVRLPDPERRSIRRWVGGRSLQRSVAA